MQSERKLHFRSILIPGPNKRWSVIVCISCTVDAPVTCQQLLFLAIIIVSCLPWSSGSCSDSEPIHFLCKQPNEVWKLFNLLLFAHNISFKHISDQVPTWSLRIQRDGFSPPLLVMNSTEQCNLLQNWHDFHSIHTDKLVVWWIQKQLADGLHRLLLKQENWKWLQTCLRCFDHEHTQYH